jgi:hypothetical protein
MHLIPFLASSAVFDEVVSRRFFGFRFFIVVLTFLIIKGLVMAFRVVEVMTSESNLFFSSSVISRGLGLKTLKRCMANILCLSLLTSGPAPVLFPDKRILCLRSFQSLDDFP